MDQRIISKKLVEEDRSLDLNLRPASLNEYIGQENVKENLSVFIQAAKARNEPLDHCLFWGPPGLGKTTLAYIIAKELGVSIKTTAGPVIERQGDLIPCNGGLPGGYSNWSGPLSEVNET